MRSDGILSIPMWRQAGASASSEVRFLSFLQNIGDVDIDDCARYRWFPTGGFRVVPESAH